MHPEVRAMRICVSELEKHIRDTSGDAADAIIRVARELAIVVQPEVLRLAAAQARNQEAESEVRRKDGDRGLARAARLAPGVHPSILCAAHAHASHLEIVRLGRQRVQEGKLARDVIGQLEELDRGLQNRLRQELGDSIPDALAQCHRLANDVDIETLWLAYRRSCLAPAERDAMEKHGESGLTEAAALVQRNPVQTLELAHCVAQLRGAEQEHPPEAGE
jgi:hypothetical protein